MDLIPTEDFQVLPFEVRFGVPKEVPTEYFWDILFRKIPQCDKNVSLVPKL